MRENRLAARAPPRTPLGELTELPRFPCWRGGASWPLPRTPTPLSALLFSDFGSLGRSFLRLSGKNPGYGPTFTKTESTYKNEKNSS